MLCFARQQVRAAWHENVVSLADPFQAKQMIEQSHQEMLLHGGVHPGRACGRNDADRKISLMVGTVFAQLVSTF